MSYISCPRAIKCPHCAQTINLACKVFSGVAAIDIEPKGRGKAKSQTYHTYFMPGAMGLVSPSYAITDGSDGKAGKGKKGIT